MFFVSLYFLGLVVCVVSTQEQNEQLYCGDLLSSSCGICALWEKDKKCDKEYARDYCAETCGHCKQDDKRTVLDVHYRGCYRDGFVNDFETMIPVQPEYLGVQSCTGECHSRGYPFAAIQDAKFCMCSKREYRRYGMASDENDCATQCLAGSEDEKCGGPWKNAVYEIASRELQSAGVRLSDIVEKLIRASKNEQQPEPESRIIDRLTEQLNRLRKRRSDYTKY